MNKYHVTYFYLASGQEGVPWEEDYGIVEAANENEAKNIIVNKKYPEDIMYGPDKAWSTKDFLKGCLQAKKVS